MLHVQAVNIGPRERPESPFSRTEWAVAQTGAADERQRSVNTEAMAYAYHAVVLVAVAGFFWELSKNEPGPFTIVCSVGGFTHMLSLAILRRRR